MIKRSGIEEHVHWSRSSFLTQETACNDKRKTRRKENVSSTLPRKKWVTAKKAMTRTKIMKAISLHIVESLLLFFPAGFAHARYSSRMTDRFLNQGDHGKPKSGKIKGRCQPPLYTAIRFSLLLCELWRVFELTLIELRSNIIKNLLFIFLFSGLTSGILSTPASDVH